MAHVPTGWPPPETDRRLAADLAAGIATAPRDIARAYLDPLTGFLLAINPHVPADLAATAGEDAILGLCQHPERFDPSQLPLGAFLRMAAKRDLANLLQQERRHHRHRIPMSGVEDGLVTGNTLPEPDDGPGWDDPRLTAAVAALSAGEREALELMRGGERRTEAFAAHLGLGHLAGPALARAVKQVKERVFKRLRRAVGGGR